ncbi:putative sulfate/molybdate transporter [Pseudonocardia acaciae]|uniref:putative sulfate/molybdate transporter n=1 Tax=Pseudonocardia acaciae TaxID=551276 RepID=UPI0009FF47AD|nr:putative sulfate/molybdate transporter [Pseudonocardia acaciae]
MARTASTAVEPGQRRWRFDRAELAGAVADLGVLVPIAVGLIVTCGLSPTAVLLPAGLLYVVSGLVYRVPVPVQPLKAFGAIVIAQDLGADVIASGALLIGVIFVVLGGTGVLGRLARVFPRPIVRGIQLSVGMLFVHLAWDLVTEPPAALADHARPTWWLLGGAVAVAVAALALRRHGITLVLLAVAVAGMVLAYRGPLDLGPSPLQPPHLSWSALATAAVVLVLPQIPLTFANACLATADTARAYFGDAASRVRPGRLAVSLGAANLLVGAIAGMPVCHGAGGMSAHRGFGARTGGAPVALGSALVVVGLTLGASLTAVLAGFPVPILAGLLAVAGLLHVVLLKDLRHPAHWALALAVGVTGVLSNLAIALVGALVVWYSVRAVLAWRERAAAEA